MYFSSMFRSDALPYSLSSSGSTLADTTFGCGTFFIMMRL
jgi:hypothetical protein